jgi:hypothetical protein
MRGVTHHFFLFAGGLERRRLPGALAPEQTLRQALKVGVGVQDRLRGTR